jgi:hypothetical protein
MHQRMDWPSSVCPNVIFCIVYRAIFDHVYEFSTYVQFSNHLVYLRIIIINHNYLSLSLSLLYLPIFRIYINTTVSFQYSELKAACFSYKGLQLIYNKKVLENISSSIHSFKRDLIVRIGSRSLIN